jgi:glucose/mannose-6-phosphate isomerase
MGGIQLDSLGLFEATASTPEQVADAAAAAKGLDGLPEKERIENVVVLGMGGSGVAGDILQAVAAPFLPVPVMVVKSHTLPAFVGESSLVFAVSCSGNTQETIEAASEAAVQGARVVAITGAGELDKLARGWGVPVVTVPQVPAPRVGVGAMAIPPFVILDEIGLFPGANEWIAMSIEQLQRRRNELAADDNPARDLARAVGRTVPLIYGGEALGGAAARRWKTQINENAKSPAFWNVLPELGHNEIEGWGQHGDVTRQVISLIHLRHETEHPQVMRRFELVDQWIRETVSDIYEVRAEGESELAQLLDLILFGDFFSLYLADQEGIDPGPTPTLDEFKLATADHRPGT